MEQIIIVLFCLGLIRFTSFRNSMPTFAWLSCYLERIPGSLLGKSSWLNLLFVFVLPLLVFSLVYQLLSADVVAGGFLGVLFAFLVLFYSVSTIANIGQMEKSLREKIQHFHSGIFAPIFWFVILGPMGALAYSLLHIIQDEAQQGNEACGSTSNMAQTILRIANWLSIRVLALVFMSSGLKQGLSIWLQYLPKGLSSSHELLERASQNALGISGDATPDSKELFPKYVDGVLVNSVIVIIIFALGYVVADGG